MDFDIVVVGAGPAGLTCALKASSLGAKVLVVERARLIGEKALMGGVIRGHILRSVIPGFPSDAPIERKVLRDEYWFLTKDAAFKLSFFDRNFGPNGYTVLRRKFDRWLAKRAEEAGAKIITSTTVYGLIREGGKVSGVLTDRGKITAKVVVGADGANSVVAKEAGLFDRRKLKAQLVVKRTYSLSAEEVSKRLGVGGFAGVCITALGFPFHKGEDGDCFIYTYKDALSVGMAIDIDSLRARGEDPWGLLDRFERHPQVEPFLDGACLLEEGAKLIPDGGYAIPRLWGWGVLLVGDAGWLVNPLTGEGFSAAVISGAVAGEVAASLAKLGSTNPSDFAVYEKRLFEHPVMRDLVAMWGISKKMGVLPGDIAGNLASIAKEYLTEDGSETSLPECRRLLRRFLLEVIGPFATGPLRGIFRICGRPLS